jgi:hypothetical protein
LGVVYFLVVYFGFQPHYFGFAFLLRLSKLDQLWLKQLRLGNLKSVGAQWSACLIFSTQILAVEKKLASALAQVLAES